MLGVNTTYMTKRLILFIFKLVKSSQLFLLASFIDKPAQLFFFFLTNHNLFFHKITKSQSYRLYYQQNDYCFIKFHFNINVCIIITETSIKVAGNKTTRHRNSLQHVNIHRKTGLSDTMIIKSKYCNKTKTYCHVS